jgi:hypothetical protein
MDGSTLPGKYMGQFWQTKQGISEKEMPEFIFSKCLVVGILIVSKHSSKFITNLDSLSTETVQLSVFMDVFWVGLGKQLIVYFGCDKHY